GRMPALQELKLKLAHRRGTRPLRLCPANWTRPLPWPELKALTVTHPDPNDPAYSLLPDTLRFLALRCWPRHYHSQLRATWTVAHEYGWSSPILSAAAMASILRRCQSCPLDTLEIEFMGDDSDVDLFRLISHAFPNLTSLTVYRCRPPHANGVPLVST
ncbi:hypothetical protein FKP32DRAFT_1544917, partial [Trametes sanguinea]